jgi:NADPH-dependent 2,4-dienoyl-CoA reductase/sulfur reductase-like enzyme/rhodanese-related sulfurtransferase
MPLKIVIVGGVAGGASAAARARRLSDDAQIIVFERGDHPSFANCGLPYYVGGEIQSRSKLLVAPIEMLKERHRLDVRTQSEIIRIDRAQKRVTARHRITGQETSETYDKLIIATGAAAFRPDVPGIESARVLELRDLNDADRMHAVATSGATRALIVGGGFIGMEVAENLVRRGIQTTVLDRNDRVLSLWDREMILTLQSHLVSKGVRLRLKDTMQSISQTDTEMSIKLTSGETILADFVVCCIGVRPENKIASDAGLQCGARGGVVTNPHMQTNDPDIYAVGDVTEVMDFVTKSRTQIPLAGPANRQGRIAADHIFGRNSTYRGTQGTAIVGVFEMSAAMTGQTEQQLQRSATRYEKIYIHPSDHAGYYPGATSMTLKLLFHPDTGAIYGAQGVGFNGVDKRIDVIAVAIQAGLTVEDLEEVELCYAPQYGSAKDPVNMAGFVASAVIRGDQPIVHVDYLIAHPDTHYLLDVRSESEYAAGHVPGATNISIETLRENLDRIPRDRPIAAYCKVGQRGYLATRVLRQNGFEAYNVSGGYTTWTRYSD